MSSHRPSCAYKGATYGSKLHYPQIPFPAIPNEARQVLCAASNVSGIQSGQFVKTKKPSKDIPCSSGAENAVRSIASPSVTSFLRLEEASELLLRACLKRRFCSAFPLLRDLLSSFGFCDFTAFAVWLIDVHERPFSVGSLTCFCAIGSWCWDDGRVSGGRGFFVAYFVGGGFIGGLDQCRAGCMSVLGRGARN